MIRFTVEMGDLLAFNRHYLSTSPVVRSGRRNLVATVAILLGLLALVRALADHSVIPLVVWGILIPLLSVWIYRRTGRIPEKRIRLSYSPDRDRLVLCEHEMENLPDGFIDITPLSEHKVKFPAIVRIDETADHVFIFTGSNQAHIIPKARLGAGDLGAFVGRLREGVRARGA